MVVVTLRASFMAEAPFPRLYRHRRDYVLPNVAAMDLGLAVINQMRTFPTTVARTLQCDFWKGSQ